MSLASNVLPGSWDAKRLLIVIVAIVFVYAYFINNVSTNPPGFYVDESCLTYNGYLIAKTGAGENGVRYPLYFQCYTQGYTQWANPTHVYLLGMLYSIIPPSTVAARVFAATMVFLAAILLGLLAYRISRRQVVGVIVALSAMFNPWLFEISRLVLETFFYPLAIVLFLYCLYSAFQREKWTILDCFLIAFTLSLITYSYTIGRLLGPLLGLGLILFATSGRLLFGVIKTWIIYALTLIPFLVVYFQNTAAITGRFARATYLSADKPLLENIGTFVSAYITDLSPYFLLFKGDNLVRHHIPFMGELLVGTFALAILGIIIVLVRHRSSAWWRYILFGLFVSVIPGSLTAERHHALRLIAFPVFFMVFLIPAITWLLEREPTSELAGEKRPFFSRRALLYSVLSVTVIQAVMFQVQYSRIGSERILEFNATYPSVLEKALADGSRPIYLDEGGEPAYVHAFWYATEQGIDLNNFVHLMDNEYPPNGALVITSEGSCSQCDVISHEGSFILYRSRRPTTETETVPVSAVSLGKNPGQFFKPFGLAVAPDGIRYVADTGNARIQKFGPEGNFISPFGSTGTSEGDLQQPHGIAVDTSGDIYIADASRHKLIKFKPDGTFVKEWHGPDVPFYGPRDIALGQDGKLYIVDQGRSRIVRFDPVTEEFFMWGTAGSEGGQLAGATGLAVAEGLVYVTDAKSNRVLVFDLVGNFQREFPVPEWEGDIQPYPDVVYDPTSKRLVVSSGKTNEVRVYDLEGNYIESIQPEPPNELNNPSMLVITGSTAKGTKLYILNTGSDNPTTGNPSIAVVDLVPAAKKK